MSFKENIPHFFRGARREELNILVWGPGDPGPDGDAVRKKYWHKRLQIRETLQREFPNAEIAFSEDEALRALTRDLEGLLTEELVHAAVADCILVLDLSRGAHVEVDRYSGYPLVAGKMWLLLPQRLVGATGLVSEIYKATYVKSYSDADFDECTLATKLCVDVVLSVAIDKRLRRYT